MKKLGFRHLMYGWLAVVVLALTSCDSENETPINDKTLPEAIEIGSTLAASVIVSLDNVCPRFQPEELGLETRRFLF